MIEKVRRNFEIWMHHSPHIFLIVIMIAIFIIDTISGQILRIAGISINGIWDNCGPTYYPLTAFFSAPFDFSILLKKPWGIISYIFLHANIWHIFFNLITLFFGSVLFLSFYSVSYYYRVFFITGVCGIIFSILVYNLLAHLSYLDIPLECVNAVGASASVMGVFTVLTLTAPNLPVFLFFIPIPVPLWIVFLIMIIIDIISLQSVNMGGHMAHIGGAATGALMYFLKHKNFSSPFKRKKFHKIFHIRDSLSSKTKRIPDTYDEEYINVLLDKIAERGINSLTPEEFEYLEKYSKYIQSK